MSDNAADLEAKLAGFVRACIEAFNRGDLTEQQEQRCWVCSAFALLLGTLLNGTENGSCTGGSMT